MQVWLSFPSAGAFNSCYHQAFALCFQSFRSHTGLEIFWGWCWMGARIICSPPHGVLWKRAPPFPSASVLALFGCYPACTRNRMGWTSVSLLSTHSTQEAREQPPLHCSLALSVKSHMLLSNGTFLEKLQETRKEKGSSLLYFPDLS